MVLHRDTMNPPNTALGNAFAQMMKNKQIKTVPMNTDLVNPVSPETIMSKAQEYKNSFTEVTAEQAQEYTNTRIAIPGEVIEREFENIWAAENNNANGLITREQLAAAEARFDESATRSVSALDKVSQRPEIVAVMSEDLASSREAAIALASSQNPLSNAEYLLRKVEFDNKRLVHLKGVLDNAQMSIDNIAQSQDPIAVLQNVQKDHLYVQAALDSIKSDSEHNPIDKEDQKAFAKAQAALDKLASKDRFVPVIGDDNDETQPGQDEYPDPEAVLHSVESRTTGPRHKKPMQKPAPYKENKPTQKKPPALFALSENRPASALLKNIFDVSTIDGVDGVDHINIHGDGITKLGRLLDMNAKTPFVHPELGMFNCVSGMWHYVKTRPMVEELRALHGVSLRHKVNQMKRDAAEDPYAPQSVGVPGFRIIMADAMWHKVTQNSEVVQLMTESTLPFDHYFTQGALNLRQYPSEGFWMVAAFEEIRRVIKHRMETGDNETQPDFTKLEDMRNPRAGIDKPLVRPQPRNQNPYGKPHQGESYFNRAR